MTSNSIFKVDFPSYDLINAKGTAPILIPINSINQSTILHKETTLENNIKYNNTAKPWMFLIIFFSIIALAYAKVNYRKRFKLLVKTVVQWKVSRQIIRFEKVYTHPLNIILNLIFLLVVSLFFSLFYITRYTTSISSFKIYIIVLIILIGYIASKLTLYRFSKWLLSEDRVIEDYIFQVNLFNKCLGVTYLVLCIFLLYTDIPSNLIFNVGAFLLMSILFIQLVRGLIIGRVHTKNMFIIILYLCTLEILPLIVIIKKVKDLL